VEPSNVLGAFGLSLLTKEKDLERIFGEHGKLESVTIIYDHGTGKSRGFGFITFADQDNAAAAKKALDGLVLNDRQMRVDYSLTHKPHHPTPGRYMG
ncbi:hypothetical protein BDK51DRAFT_13193, partial [Blyttiomyces helicus]